MDRQDDILAFLPDHGFEQALLAPEPRVDRRLRAADHADDLVDRDVVVALLQEQRSSRANDAFATLLNGPYEGPPALERWTLNLASGALTTDTLDDHPLEFPRIDERLTCHPHRYAYAAHYGENVEHGPAYKYDLATGKTLVHKYGKGRVTLEPLFVPRHDSAAEDDGWVMSFVYDATTNRSDVVILDSQDFKRAPIATIHLPVRVPFGFHGTWIPDP